MVTEEKIQEGIRQKQFILHYQPKVSLVTGSVVGAEALIRWLAPSGDLVQPCEFIPIAERSLLIKEITGHIFSLLVDHIVASPKKIPFPLSFNVSGRDFEDTVLSDQILDAIRVNQMDPTVLEVEITESQALSGGEDVIRNISRLGDAGIALTMDDYGIGYSSIDSLSKWPFTTIKLDQGIIGRMLTSQKNATIVRSSIRLGHELNIKVIAEGIETYEQCQFLLESGCNAGQGYLISKPLTFEDFLDFANKPASPGIPAGLIHMAILDHVQWRKQLVSYTLKRADLPPQSPGRQTGGYPELSFRKCCLGAWYFNDGQKFCKHEPFVQLDRHHRMLHLLGTRIVERIQSGALSKDIAPLLSDLKICSGHMLMLLESLEDLGLADLYARH